MSLARNEMKLSQKLFVNIGDIKKNVDFGVPQSKKELEEMYRFRYDNYARKNYLLLDKFTETKDFDEYDKAHKCDYFVATNSSKIVGNVRVVRDDILPTEKFFEFEEPEVIRSIPRFERAELSRLIITPYDKSYYLPRNLMLLLFIRNLVMYAQENGIKGGYSFIKEKLKQKLLRLGVPIHLIKDYELVYPKDGLMYPYFYDKDDPVVPMVFIVDEIAEYVDKTIHNSWMFDIIDKNTFVLKDNLYNNFLKKIGAI